MARSMKILKPFDAQGAAQVYIGDGKRSATYDLQNLEAPWGLAGVLFTKEGTEAGYQTFVDPGEVDDEGKPAGNCECKAFEFRHTCRHIDCLRKLIEMGMFCVSV